MTDPIYLLTTPSLSFVSAFNLDKAKFYSVGNEQLLRIHYPV